ncbi:MAG: 1-acyl-sn-glycerol-3-phosphate acyltransferase [Chloroflexi bacterium]|nr:1-acyl-sn-glycerol-3-phosphate acyltransferase [Chloroflexota bacterium]
MTLAPAVPTAAYVRERWATGGPARLLRAAAWATVLEPLVRAFYRVRAEGVANLEALRGPVLFAANHCAHLDTCFIIASLPWRWRSRLSVAASASKIFGPRLFGLPMKGALAALLGNAFPLALPRGHPRDNLLTVMVAAGWSVLLYPEGRLCLSGTIERFRGGVGIVVIATGAEVVPVRVAVDRPGLWEGNRFGRGDVRVVFGEPRRFGNENPPSDVARELEATVRSLGAWR